MRCNKKEKATYVRASWSLVVGREELILQSFLCLSLLIVQDSRYQIHVFGAAGTFLDLSQFSTHTTCDDTPAVDHQNLLFARYS